MPAFEKGQFGARNARRQRPQIFRPRDRVMVPAHHQHRTGDARQPFPAVVTGPGLKLPRGAGGVAGLVRKGVGRGKGMQHPVLRRVGRLPCRVAADIGQ